MLTCKRCLDLERQVSDLRALNTRLADALRSQVSRPSNTDMILGAALSGGDPIALAKELAQAGGKGRSPR